MSYSLLLNTQRPKGVAYFIYALTLDLGICTFVGFVGNRLQFSVRRRFLLNYQVEVSRDKQREVSSQTCVRGRCGYSSRDVDIALLMSENVSCVSRLLPTCSYSVLMFRLPLDSGYHAP